MTEFLGVEIRGYDNINNWDILVANSSERHGRQ